MKILIITYSYPPALTPRAFRWSAVAAQLARNGYKVHVLCAADGSSEAADGVTVYRVRDWLLNASARVTAGSGSATPAASGKGSGVRSLLRPALRALWRAFYWPDFACGWILPATRAARALCTAHDYDWIVSVSHPFTGHLVGLLARSKAPRARWFVDIGDPFCLMDEPAPNNFCLYRRLNRWVEQRVVENADAISVTTDSTRQLYESQFSLPAGKIEVVPPLLSLSDPPPPSPRGDQRTVRLVFVGTLYRRLRSPRFLLACFVALKEVLPEYRLELHFFGSANDCSDELAAGGEGVFIHGLVGRAEVLQAMVDADVLVNIGNDSEAQLASKVIEYMAVGRPILNLISIARDTSVVALSDYSAVLNIERSDDNPSNEVVNRIREFVLAPPAVPLSVAEAVRACYSAEVIAVRYAAILEGCRR